MGNRLRSQGERREMFDSAVTSKLNVVQSDRLVATLRDMSAYPCDRFGIVRNNSIQPKALKMMVILD